MESISLTKMSGPPAYPPSNRVAGWSVHISRLVRWLTAYAPDHLQRIGGGHYLISDEALSIPEDTIKTLIQILNYDIKTESGLRPPASSHTPRLLWSRRYGDALAGVR